MKKGLALLLAVMICLSAVPAQAGWEVSDGRYWYSYEDGSWAANRWIQDGAWYYMDGDGWMVTGWKQVGGNWYYFGSFGAMATGWRQIGGSWYYFGTSGAMATGWYEIGGSWYYFEASGVMATGWRQIGGSWYYFDDSGMMKIGWQRDGDNWYFLTSAGTMATGWQMVGNNWYFLNQNGVMETGWRQISGKWYYLDENGAMKTGWLKDGGVWYYLDASGTMVTGWQSINSATYYFQDNGTMVTGDVEINGKNYKFDSDGKCQEKIKLVIWSFTNELQGMIEKYYAPNHPEVEFEFHMVPIPDFTAAVDAQMATAGDADEAPDIFALEASFVKQYTDSDWTADLKTVGFTDEELSVAFPVMAEIGADTRDGTQKGLSWQSAPGVMFYRADLAEKYLGVKTPEEFQTMVKDWNSFLATAKKLNEASEGACKIITGPYEIWTAYQYQRDQGWVVDGKLNIDGKLYDYEELVKDLEDNDLTRHSSPWTEVWFCGMRGDLQTMCYFLPTWGLHYTLKPNCAVGWEDWKSDEENLAALGENKGTYGAWRMTDGPVAYNWGGSWIAANAEKVSTADGAKKAAIHDLISYFTLEDEFLVQYAKDTGDFVGSSQAVNVILEEGGAISSFLGGQNYYEMFAKVAALLKGTLMTKYDETLGGLWEEYVTRPYVNNDVTVKNAEKDFRKVVSDKIPSLKVD